MNPWQLYDDLVDGIPAGLRVTDAVVSHQAVVRSDRDGVGVAMTYDGGPAAARSAWDVVGRDLRDVAALARSWDLRLASLGVAAMNAWYASAEHLAGLPGVERGVATAFFAAHHDELARRRSVVVGHFRDVDTIPGITVLERSPRGADLPDPAAEFVLPEAELVVITGSTLVNKTLPRLLALAVGAEVHLVGPTAPAAPEALPPCVRGVAGSEVLAPDAALGAARLGLRPADTDVRMFHLTREDHPR